MRRLFFCISISVAVLVRAATPDFAYPAKVRDNSIANIDKGIVSNDGPLTVRSLMDCVLASSAIDTDSIDKSLALVETTASRSGSDDVKALCSLLRARILSDIYQENKYNADKRNIPLSPLPASTSEWSGGQFRTSIIKAVNAAISNSTTSTSPIAQWLGITTLTKNEEPLYPTLRDFIAYQGISILSDITDPDTDTKSIINQIYASLITSNRDNIPALINARTASLRYSRPTALNDSLLALSRQYPDSPYGAEALLEVDIDPNPDMSASEISQWKNLTDDLQRRLTRFPKYIRNNCLRNKLNILIHPGAQLNSGVATSPDEKLEVQVSDINSSKIRIDIFRVPTTVKTRDNLYRLTSADIVTNRFASVTVSAPDTLAVPFIWKTKVTLPSLPLGRYVIVPVADGCDSQIFNSYYTVVRSTNLMGIATAYSTERWTSVVDSKDGSPVRGATVTGRDHSGKILWTSTTGKTGEVSQPSKSTDGYIYISKGNDRYPAPVYQPWSNPNPGSRPAVAITAFTSLPLYHPGDSVQFSAVMQNAYGTAAHPVANARIATIIRNANNQPVDTISYVTDNYGRIYGSFRLPDEGLTGNWFLTFTQASSNGKTNVLGSKMFTVSDYRLPEFEVTITDIIRRGDVTISGTAATYSGFPAAGATVGLNLKATRRIGWRWFGSEQSEITRDSVNTDSDGKFTFLVSDSIMKRTPWPDAVVEAEVTFTSTTGEVVTTSRRFALGPQYNLDVTLPESIELSDSFKFTSRLSDLENREIKKDLTVKIFKDGEPIECAVTSDNTLNLSKLDQGRYGFIFQPTDTTLANSTDTLFAVLYSKNAKSSPLPDQLLWTRTSSVKTAPNGKADILYALGNATGWIYYALTTDSVLIDRRSLNAGSGMHTLQISLPDGIDNATLTLWAAGNHNTSSQTITISRPAKVPELKIEVESMRDHLIPGAKEQWTVRITNPDGSPSRAALLMNLFAKSITTLKPQSLSLTALSSTSAAYYAINYKNNGRLNEYITAIGKTLNCKTFNSPMLQTYGMSFYPVLHYLNDMRSYATGALNKTIQGVASAKMMARADAIKEEATLEESTVTSDADAGASNSENGGNESENIDYREAEVPLALFNTSLTTGTDGKTVVSFTLPNANTTWRLLATAYDHDMNIGSLQRDMVASKPLMVKPNLPRFLRQGDNAEVMASVMNATDSTLITTSIIETFNPLNGAILSSDRFTDTIKAGSAAIVSTKIKATATGAVGYRVRSSSLGFTDGEQTLLPVLPAAQPVIKSDPFYFNATDTIAVISRKKGNEATIVINTNPLWSVVTAIPGLTDNSDKTASSATTALFGAAVANGLVTTNNWIRTGLTAMTANPQDSALISALQHNQSLKMLMLNQTPWVSAAMSQTERMADLSLLLEPGQTDKVIDKALTSLSKLQRTGGGLAWREQSPTPSVWMTRNFLLRASQLNDMGYTPSDSRYDNIVRRAVIYCDSLVAIDTRKNANYIDIEYTFMRAGFPAIRQNADAGKMSARTVAWIKKNWKQLSLENKAKAAIILKRDNDMTTASQILESISQFCVQSKTLGTYIPSISKYSDLTSTAIIYEAFKAIHPESAVTEGLRQWLLLQKEARDWGSAQSTSWVVASLLTATKYAPDAKMAITLQQSGSSSVIDTPAGCATTLKVKPDFTLTVNKSTGEPLWGAIIDKSVQLPSKVKAHATADLSISKRLLKQMPDGQWREATEFSVGDIVEVSLTLKAGRNLDFVTINDMRAATFQPSDQLPGYIYAENLAFYRENNDASTNIFIDTLPRGTYVLSYRVTVNNAGDFTSGIATVQSQYSPGETANSTAPDIHVISTNH